MESSINIVENKWIALLCLHKPNKLTITPKQLSINDIFVNPSLIEDLVHTTPILLGILGFSRLSIHHTVNTKPHTTTFVLPTLLSNSAYEASRKIIEDILSSVIHHLGQVTLGLQEKIKGTFTHKVYLRRLKAKSFIDSCEPEFRKAISVSNHLANKKLLTEIQKNSLGDIQVTLREIAPYIRDFETQRAISNKAYIEFYKEKDAEFFNTVESSKLTEEQIDAALIFEDATLVGAAAGSGKSSCIVGKIGFALKNGLFRDEDILALAYNKDAAKSLAERLQTKLTKALDRKINVRSMTFHSFGLSILSENKGDGYSAKVLNEEGKEENRCIKNAIEKLISTNTEFQELVADWVCFSSYESPQPVGVSDDLEECQRLYEECCLERIQARKDFKRASYLPTIPTFDEETYVRSLEERSIANWLLLRGIEFAYEKANFDGGRRLGLKKSDAGKQRPYTPDFTYQRQLNNEGQPTSSVTVIHEHFGLDENGKAPDWMGGPKYEQQAQSKRTMFEAWVRDTAHAPEKVVFFETRSCNVRDGSIWQLLESKLKQYGIAIRAPSDEIRNRALNSFRQSKEFEKTLIDFVLKYKDSGYSKEEVFEKTSNSYGPYRALQFVKIAFMVLDAYEEELGDRVDFPDMLREAVNILKTPSDKRYPKLVLVDEFQDISHLKASLVKALLDTQPEDSIVFFVGDDWQTINRFSGSDVSIFTGAADYFGRHTASLDLTRTFRCRKGIAEVSRDLVLQNKNQSQKKVVASTPSINNEIRIVCHGPHVEDRQGALHDELSSIVNTARTYLADIIKDRLPTVYILTRTTNEYTIPDGLSEAYLKGITKQYKTQLDIRYMSMHGSKGLEADFVIMVGLESGPKGFPDERPAEPLFDLILPKLTNSIEEERRLFYVGLTRARHQAIILANAERPSLFLFDLEKLKDKFSCIEWVTNDLKRSPCPKCHVGSLIHYKQTELCSRISVCGFRPKRARRTKTYAK